MTDNHKQELLERVNKVLAELRPHLWADDGDVKIVEITEEYDLVIQWLGACTNCKLSHVTLKYGIKQAVLEKVKEIRDVIVA